MSLELAFDLQVLRIKRHLNTWREPVLPAPRKRGPTRRLHVSSPRVKQHGRYTTYRHGCRCKWCCTANTAYQRTYEARQRVSA